MKVEFILGIPSDRHEGVGNGMGTEKLFGVWSFECESLGKDSGLCK